MADTALTEIEKLEAAIKAVHGEAWEKLMNAKSDEDLAIDAEAEEVSAFLDANPFLAEPGTRPHDGSVQFYNCDCRFCAPQRQLGGWVHRAAFGTLPTFTTHQGVYAALPEKED